MYVENSNDGHLEQPSTSVGATGKKPGDSAVERPSELMPLRRSNNVPVRRGSHTKTGRIAATSVAVSSADASRSPSLERPRQWQCQTIQSQLRSWWRRRSVAGDVDALPGDSGDASAPVSPASTPASSRASDFVGGAVVDSGGGSGTQSKSSSRSGSSRSAFRIFKAVNLAGGSQSSQNSKARIVSCATFSQSPSVSRNNGAQKHSSPAASTASQCAAMRASLAAATAASKSALKLVHVHTLTKQNIVVSVERKCQVWDVFHSCCVHLGIDDDRLFGLALRRPCEGFGGAEDRPRHEYFFLDPEQQISKYVPKEAKHSSSATSAMSSPVSKLKRRSRGCGTTSKPIIVLYMRVRVYVRRIDAISCDVALRHYYLQLRENLIDQWSAGPHSGASEEACWGLAALAILTDRGREWRSFMAGDTTAASASAFAFRAEQYFPLWVINARGLDYVQENMPKVLRGYGTMGGFVSARSSLGGGGTSTASTSSSSASPPIYTGAFTETDAMFQFCQEASRGPFALNCHLYGLRRQKTDILNNALIGITDKGIDLWDVGLQGERVLMRSLTWARLSCLSFDNKRITIAGLDGTRLVFYAESESKARYLLAFCREVHQQLLQINTNFVLNRPPSSPLLPPGWGLEQLIDASPHGGPSSRCFHSADYGLPVPTFSPRSDSNPPEISSFNAVVVNHHAATSVTKPTPQQTITSVTEETKTTTAQPEVGVETSKLVAVSRIPAETAPNRSQEAVEAPGPPTFGACSPVQNSTQPTSGAQKVRRFKKAGYERRASSPIAVRRIVSSDDGTAAEQPRNVLAERPECVPDTAEQTTSLEAAMNAAPSPPRYPLAQPSAANSPAVQSAASADSTVSLTPKSALKRPNSSKQTQIPIVTGQSTSFEMPTSAAVCGSPIMTHHYQQQIAAYHPMNNGIPAKSSVATPSYAPQKLMATTVVTNTTTKLRPPPQYAEAVEQLRKRNNLGTQTQSEDVNNYSTRLQQQPQVLYSQYSGNGESFPSHATKTPKHPPINGHFVYEMSTPKRTNPHFHHRHESGSRWQTVSGGIDTAALQKNFEARRMEPSDSARKYDSVVESKKENDYDSRKTQRDPESAGLQQFEQLVASAHAYPQSHAQQPLARTSRATGQLAQVRRYASQSPTARNRIKDVMMEPLPSFPTVQQQHPAVVVIEKQVPFYGHGAAKNAVNALAVEHSKEPSISNTEKFKNYPMMKALWEARHDLTATAEAAQSRYDYSGQPSSNGGAGNGVPPPPPYAQYVQHVSQQPNPNGTDNVVDVTSLSAAFTTATAFQSPQQPPAAAGNGAVPSVVMDLPPPPPYPQSAMGATAQRVQPTGRKAAVM